MAEGTSLLRKHTGKTCIVGSNPTVSARILSRMDIKKPLFPPWGSGFFVAAQRCTRKLSRYCCGVTPKRWLNARRMRAALPKPQR